MTYNEAYAWLEANLPETLELILEGYNSRVQREKYDLMVSAATHDNEALNSVSGRAKAVEDELYTEFQEMLITYVEMEIDNNDKYRSL